MTQTKVYHSEEEIMEVAWKAYTRKSAAWKKEYGCYLPIPSQYSTEVGAKNVYFRNCNGLITKWNFRTRKFVDGEKDKVW